MNTLLVLLLLSWVHAQDVTVVQPETFCRIDQFSPKLNQPPTAAYKVCDSLKDAKDVPSKTQGECKERALSKGSECLKKLAKANIQVAVRAKYTEKFKVSSQTSTFTCELDRSGGSSCP